MAIHNHGCRKILTFAPRLDENGLCAIGTLTTHDNKNAMAYADICVVMGVDLI